MKIQIDSKDYSKLIPEELVEDDDIIDYFFENNKDWIVCEQFLQGYCKFGE